MCVLPNDERNVIFEMKMAVAGGMDLIGSHLLVCGWFFEFY